MVDPYAFVTQPPWKRVCGQSCGLCVCAHPLEHALCWRTVRVLRFHPELLSAATARRGHMKCLMQEAEK